LNSKRVGYAAIAFGVLVALVAVLADPLGIGGDPAIGWKQGFLLSVGVSVALGGFGVMHGWFAGLAPKGRGDRPRRVAARRSPARPAAPTPHDIDDEA
jgi:hypothetical protein